MTVGPVNGQGYIGWLGGDDGGEASALEQCPQVGQQQDGFLATIDSLKPDYAEQTATTKRSSLVPPPRVVGGSSRSAKL